MVSVKHGYRAWAALNGGVPSTPRRAKTGGVSRCAELRFYKSLLSDEVLNQILYAIQSLRAAGAAGRALLDKPAACFKSGTPTGRGGLLPLGTEQNGRREVVRLKSALIGRRALGSRLLLFERETRRASSCAQTHLHG